MKRKKKLLWAFAAIPLLFLLLIIWGLVEPYILDEEEETAIIPNLPTAWEGQIIAQVSDFQVGMWWDSLNTIAQSVGKLIAEQPATVLITGDFIYHALPEPETEINKVIELIRPLTEANIPTYAVLGNHDYGMKNQKMPPKTELATQLEQALKNIGIRVLTNEAVNLPLENQDSDLYLVGIGSNWANNDKLDKIAQDFEQLLKDENLQEIVDSDSISEINRNTFVPLISDRIYLSQQDVQHIASTQIRKQEVWD